MYFTKRIRNIVGALARKFPRVAACCSRLFGSLAQPKTLVIASALPAEINPPPSPRKTPSPKQEFGKNNRAVTTLAISRMRTPSRRSPVPTLRPPSGLALPRRSSDSEVESKNAEPAPSLFAATADGNVPPQAAPVLSPRPSSPPQLHAARSRSTLLRPDSAQPGLDSEVLPLSSPRTDREAAATMALLNLPGVLEEPELSQARQADHEVQQICAHSALVDTELPLDSARCEAAPEPPVTAPAPSAPVEQKESQTEQPQMATVSHPSVSATPGASVPTQKPPLRRGLSVAGRAILQGGLGMRLQFWCH